MKRLVPAAGSSVARATTASVPSVTPSADSGTDLKIVIYTAAPGSEDETKLALARVAGTARRP